MSYEYAGQPVVVCMCGERIYFVELRLGDKMPVTYETGEVHWATCPDGDRYRRRRRQDDEDVAAARRQADDSQSDLFS